MKVKKISKASIRRLLKQCVENWETYVPLQNEEGDTFFTLLPKDTKGLKDALDRINLKDEWVAISPKDIFLPQLERMFSFDNGKIIERVEATRKLIFGVKPCDTKGILFTDEFFKRNFEDTYYLSRSKDRLIVTIGCITPPRPKACFCTSAKTGPFIADGFDLQLVDIGDAYVVEVGSRKAEEFVNSYSTFFTNAEKNDLEKVENVKSEAAKGINVKVDFEKALKIIKNDKDFEQNYKRIGERCIYCGGCIYVCPTCTCFNVFDDNREGRGVRMRNWDTCVFEGYTREASGHNPRREKWLRTSRRYEHKLKYDYEITGISGCIACGRCLSSCPVEIGMSKFINEITANKRNM